MKSSGNDSSRSARTTKSAPASAPRSSSSKKSKNIVENFMKDLMTTEKLMKKMEYKNKVIVTDSEYVIKCATTYGEKLAKANWEKKDKEIPNLSLVKKVYELTNKYDIKYKHVKAHTGNKDRHSISNYYADKLANDSIGISSSEGGNEKNFLTDDQIQTLLENYDNKSNNNNNKKKLLFITFFILFFLIFCCFIF